MHNEPAAAAAGRCQFASDNTAGICPEAWAAMAAANRGYQPSYGEDPLTAAAADLFRQIFETACDVFFVFNGTAANSLALAALCQSYHSVIAHEAAHVETDECGAPEFFSNGTKLLLAQGNNGKLDPAQVERLIVKRTDIHYPKPRVVTLTQPSELGTIYSPAQIQAISAVARKHGLRVHMDGARFANAVAALGATPADLTWRAGVDVLCFGGTKLGMATSEAVVFFDRELAHEFDFRCKQAGQLASKMRFLAAPWIALLEGGTWLKLAGYANSCARGLAAKLQSIPRVRLLYPVDANAVFVELPEDAHEGLARKGWRYYRFIGGGARFMCSWSITPADIDELAADVRALV